MFTVACFLILLMAAAHNTGFLMAKSSGPEEDKVLAAMKDFHNDMGMGMSPSNYDLFLALAFSMTVLMVGLGVTGLVVSASRSVSSEVIRTLSWIYLAWVAVFTIIGYYYRVPPPVISGVVVGLALLVGLVVPAKSSEDPAPVSLSKHANQAR
jgi:hypothetical protein